MYVYKYVDMYNQKRETLIYSTKLLHSYVYILYTVKSIIVITWKNYE